MVNNLHMFTTYTKPTQRMHCLYHQCVNLFWNPAYGEFQISATDIHV